LCDVLGCCISCQYSFSCIMTWSYCMPFPGTPYMTSEASRILPSSMLGNELVLVPDSCPPKSYSGRQHPTQSLSLSLTAEYPAVRLVLAWDHQRGLAYDSPFEHVSLPSTVPRDAASCLLPCNETISHLDNRPSPCHVQLSVLGA
jgi:hypothetical protein